MPMVDFAPLPQLLLAKLRLCAHDSYQLSSNTLNSVR
jgi:hypothetical protein